MEDDQPSGDRPDCSSALALSWAVGREKKGHEEQGSKIVSKIPLKSVFTNLCTVAICGS